MRSVSSTFHLVFLLCFAVGFSACTPRLSPLYRDYAIPLEERNSPDVYVKIRDALQAAGWKLFPSEITNVVRTEPQTLSRWGIYKVTAYVEAVPIGEDHVRIYFHPYREYVIGGRSKIPFLSEGIREDLLLPLHRELEKQGLQPSS